MRRFARFWARALVTGGKAAIGLGSLVVLVVGGSGIVYWREAHTPHRVWWIVGGALVLVAVLMFAAYRQWDEAERQLSRLMRQKVPDEHRGQIHELLRTTVRQVWSESKVDYGDSYDGEPTNHQVLRAHIPDLVTKLDAWDGGVDRAEMARERLKDELRREAKSRGLPTPELDGWNVLVESLSNFLIDRAVVANLGAPYKLAWSRIDYAGAVGPTPGLGREIELRLGREVVGHLPGGSEKTVAERYESLTAAVDELAGAVSDGPQAIELRDATDDRNQRMMRLRDLINDWLKTSVFAVEPDCPTCRRNLGLSDRERVG